MNTKKLITSILYNIGEIGQGLLMHPYQTMQSLQQEKVFAWMTLFPSGVLATTTLIWRFVIVPFVRNFFSCSTSQFWACESVFFLAEWMTFFCIYWQILLLYLLFRFSSVLGKSQSY